MRPERDAPAPVRPVRRPWGTLVVAAAPAAATGPWWRTVQVPRADRTAGPVWPGSAVPVSGPAARDADGDGVPDTLVVETPGGLSLWSDLDGDGLADRVRGLGLPPEPVEGLLPVVSGEGAGH